MLCTRLVPIMDVLCIIYLQYQSTQREKPKRGRLFYKQIINPTEMDNDALYDSSLKYTNSIAQTATMASTKSSQKKSRRHANKKQQPLTQSLKQFESAYQTMLNKADSALEKLPGDAFEFEQQCQFSETRRKYCKQILKYLLVGYQEIVKQANMKKFYINECQISAIIADFIHKAPSFTKSIQLLAPTAKQLEVSLFQFYNTAGSARLQSNKYRLQMKYLLQNLADPHNHIFRENITTGIYEPGFVSLLDQLMMMNPNKREYVESGCASEKYLQPDYEQIMRRREREKKYQTALHEARRMKMSKEIQSTIKNVEQKSIEYFLSNKFVEKLEIELMEIPERTFRKRALLNLKTYLWTDNILA